MASAHTSLRMHPAAHLRSNGFALVEWLLASSLLLAVATGSVVTLFSANEYAAKQRHVSAAKALCQERIEEALVRPFTSTTVPGIFGGIWPLPTVETVTSTDTVPIYMPQDSATAALVTGTRTVRVTRYTPVVADPAFVFARVRVRVEFWVKGRGLNNRRATQSGAQPFSYEMTTLRSPD